MQDGLQEKDLPKIPVIGISHDRLLMRIREYLYIVVTIGGIIGFGIVWGIKMVREFDQFTFQMTIMQQQISRLEQLIVTNKKK